jgi:hypothetical protein
LWPFRPSYRQPAPQRIITAGIITIATRTKHGLGCS